jgi:hypothetical protein
METGSQAEETAGRMEPIAKGFKILNCEPFALAAHDLRDSSLIAIDQQRKCLLSETSGIEICPDEGLHIPAACRLANCSAFPEGPIKARRFTDANASVSGDKRLWAGSLFPPRTDTRLTSGIRIVTA